MIGEYPLQIYASGLLFSLHKSVIRNMFVQETPEFIARSPNVDLTWSPVLSVLETSPETMIRTMSFSTTSEMLAIITSDSELFIWKVSDCSLHKRARYDDATLLTTSPDLQWLVVITMRCSSETEHYVQGALEVHELNSNHVLWTRTLDGRKVLAMKISHDSRWLAVCFEDEIHLYAREGGVPRSWCLQLGLDTEPSDIASWRIEIDSDCSVVLLLYGNGYNSVVALDLRTGMQYHGPDLDDYDLAMDEDINDSKFLPNTRLIMLCGGVRDTCIYLWDFLKGECREWLNNDNRVNCLTYSHTGSWITTTSEGGVELLCRDRRTVLRQVQLPVEGGLGEIQIAHDDRNIAVRSQTKVWLLDVQIILTDELSSDTEEATYHTIMKDGVSVVSYDPDSTIRIESPMGETIDAVDIRNGVSEKVNDIVFLPEAKLLASNDWSSIHVWDLERARFRYSFDAQAFVLSITLSSDDSCSSQWIAVRTPFQVLVWNVSTGQFQQPIELPNRSGREPATMCFAGSQLGVLWLFPCVRHSGDGRHGMFALYDIQTGQQLAQLELPYFWNEPRSLCYFCNGPRSLGGNLCMSPDGKWIMSAFEFGRLLLSDVKAGIQCAVVDIDARWFSFIDDTALCTDQGVIYLDSILNSLAVKRWGGRTQILNRKDEVIQKLPVVTPTVDKYGRDNQCEWITLDNRPLMWLPQQFRLDTDNCLGQMAIGHHNITIESYRGMYCIVFRSDAGKKLRQAISNLSI